MSILMYLFVAVAGGLNVLQSGTNAELARSLERPWLVGMIVSLSTALVFAVGTLVAGGGLPPASKLAAAPWWAWPGGFCGAMFVIGTLFFSQKLGSGPFTGISITAGIVVSILLDHFGLVGFKQHPAGVWRLLGAAMMISGLVLVARF